MSRINNNVQSLIAQRVLGLQNQRLNATLQRLSTGLRINTGRDDPAGLIASESLRNEMRAITAAQQNISRANNVVTVAESGLSEIASLLNDLEHLIDISSNESAISADERQANQLEIDAILASINRIANTTELQGRKLLNGALAYTTSGVKISQIADVRLNSVRVPAGSTLGINVQVTQIASAATVTYMSGTIAGSARTIEVAGKLGREVFTFGVGTTNANMVSAINAVKGVTGVSAVVSGANYVKFYSTGYGSSEFVSVRLLSGSSFKMINDRYTDNGQDVVARVNGMTVQGNGLKISPRGSVLNGDLTLSVGFATQTAATATFHVTGGGATFAITPQLDGGSIARIGINAVTTASLGDRNTGLLFSLGTGETNALNTQRYKQAQDIVRLAATQIAELRGRLGSFQKSTLDTTQNSLMVTYENVSSAESQIRDADFAAETSNLTRSQILVQSAGLVLANTNRAPQNVLQLLQQ